MLEWTFDTLQIDKTSPLIVIGIELLLRRLKSKYLLKKSKQNTPPTHKLLKKILTIKIVMSFLLCFVAFRCRIW